MGVKKARIPFAAGVDLCSYEVNNKALSETGTRREKDEKGFIWCLLLSFAAGGIFTFAPMPPGAAGFPDDTENWNGPPG